MFKVSNEKQLLRLLKMISSEAVSLSRESLTEQKDPYQRKYTSDFKADEGVYGSLSEQDEEPEEDLEGEEEAEPEAEGDEEAEGEGEGEDLPAEEPAEESPEGETAAAFGASFDSVLTAINSLRAGRSLKENAIKDATSSYYDSLSEEEVEEEEVEGEGEGTGVEGEETEAEGEEEGEEEGEDVTPPIKVNEAQDFTQVRKKLRRLMLRG